MGAYYSRKVWRIDALRLHSQQDRNSVGKSKGDKISLGGRILPPPPPPSSSLNETLIEKHTVCVSKSTELFTNLITLLKKSVSDLAGLRWNTSGSRVLSHKDALNLTIDRMKLAALNAYRIKIVTYGCHYYKINMVAIWISLYELNSPPPDL